MHHGIWRSYTTQLPNAHNTTARRVFYDYHPWADLDVCIDCVVEKSGVRVARGRLIDDAPGLPLELPLWMFDRLACSAIRHWCSAQVDIAALAGRRLQLPPSPLRAHYVKARVKVRHYPDGTLAIFHEPRLLARYDAKGRFEQENIKAAA